ncbi:MAG: DUF2252 domain-containing protein [Thermomicrobiales bacterium]
MELKHRIQRPIEDLRAKGVALRKQMPRREHARLVLPERDVVAILEEQHRSRIPDLVPVRIGRMLQSPFALYRGSAAVMAHDLADAPCTGIEVIACGDAHVSNFGLYGTPERTLAFDLNDFDEASNAPWEWDVKRLAASAYIGALDTGLRADQARDIARASVTSYREMLTLLMGMTALERYYYRGETAWLQQTLDSDTQRLVRHVARKAKRNTSDRMLDKIELETVDGATRIVEEPPIMRHDAYITPDLADQLMNAYLRTVRADIAVLLSQFSLVDGVLRVVGVGSVGTRCYIQLLEGPSGEPFFLQIKEAQASVLEAYGGRPSRIHDRAIRPRSGVNGFRAISCQRTLQAASDPFLGYFEIGGRDYYVRQFRDMKGSLDLATLDARQFEQYAQLCGALLARGHGQSPTAGIVEGYLLDSARFDDAIADWAVAYAEVVERDFETVEAAVKAGRLPVEHGV